MSTIQTLLLTLGLGTCWAYRNRKCDAKLIAKRLGFNPNSWKLISRGHTKYHLMFYSDGNLPSVYKCLCTTTVTDKAGEKYRKNVKIHYSPNETTTYFGNRVQQNVFDQSSNFRLRQVCSIAIGATRLPGLGSYTLS
ncbi:uncharacterized protein LOC142570934 isoform X2 [Dermacentor variabilis]|uniref:uncharacterized protein LOC142570934 isoform X2 n=1 Tax=Dermacentor variabilis TaxID=34621 RepID=UPI003F5C8C47